MTRCCIYAKIATASKTHPFLHRSNRAMQRATFLKSGIFGTSGILLAMFLSSPARALDSHPESSLAGVMAASEMKVPDRWRDYALSTITPRFSWAVRIPRTLPQVTDSLDAKIPFRISLGSLGEISGFQLNLSMATAVVDHRAPALAGDQLDLRAELPGVGLKRTMFTPSFVGSWGKTGHLGVSAILAYQRFASIGLGETELRGALPYWSGVSGESSYGAGLRLDAGSSFTGRLSWSAAYQSRVNMDALNTLRGVYSDPGQFDIPSSASVGFSYALTPALSFDLGVQRVMFSELTPFTSPALPRRFLSLLGSGASPTFAWQDLDVYSAGWTLRKPSFGNVELRYTTRQQPAPTSGLLRNALEASPADHTVALGYSRPTGRNSNLNLQAIYSSAPYFLGLPSYRSVDRVNGNQVEYEAAWSVRF